MIRPNNADTSEIVQAFLNELKDKIEDNLKIANDDIIN